MKMNKTDKAIVVLLISLGIFSASQAINYIKTLSIKDKKNLFTVATMKNKNIILCEVPFKQVADTSKST